MDPWETPWSEPRAKSLTSQINSWSVDPQSPCPLYETFPSEIRLLIFSYALTEDEVTLNRRGWALSAVTRPAWLIRQLSDEERGPEVGDADLKGFDYGYYSQSGQRVKMLRDKWLRPGCVGWIMQHTALLRTCRRIFIESRDLVTDNATRRVFGDNATAPPHFGKLGFNQDTCRISNYTANRITKFHLFLSVATLANGYLSTHHLEMRAVRDLRLTIRKTDWEHPMSSPEITPYGNGKTFDGENPTEGVSMREHMRLTQGVRIGEVETPIPPIPFRLDVNTTTPWGQMISRFPYLERFTMDFEHSENKFSELLEVAEWAHRVWRFRLGGYRKGYFLSAAGNPIKKSSWRGISCHWDSECVNHREGQAGTYSEASRDIAACCSHRRELLQKGLGPRMYTFTVTWTACRLGSDFDDDGTIFGPEYLPQRRAEGPQDCVLERPLLVEFS
jgi:hypothetical protein